jgi:8-oxo-dGTP pyrophosphatase MutT (NUDIX family)
MLAGTSLIAFHGGNLLLATRITDALELTGIGGGLEDSDPSHRACVLRETLEETGTTAELVDPPRCLHVGFDGSLVESGDANGLAAVVERSARGPHGAPWDYSVSAQRLRVEVFLGRLAGAPHPTVDVPLFVSLARESVREAAATGLDTGAAVSAGALRVVAGTVPEPAPARCRLVDSLEALFLALGDDAEAFLTRAESWVGTSRRTPTIGNG